MKIYNQQKTLANRKDLRKNMSKAEVVFWNYVRNQQLGIKFRRQFSIGSFIVDFYAPQLKLAIEIDGSQHFEEDETIDYDKQRQQFIEQYGITFLRFTTLDVFKNLEGVIETVLNEIQKLENKPHPSPSASTSP